MRVLIFLCLVLLLNGCSKDPIPDPSPAVLLNPLNNNICVNSENLSSLISNVNFVWQSAENSDSYELVIQNQINDEIFKYNTKSTNWQVNLKRGFPYSWWVNSLSQSSSTIIKSQVWNFYLESISQLSYLPFPAELKSPDNNSTVSLVQNKLNLLWNGLDLDNDISHYLLKLGIGENELFIIEENIKENSLEVSLEPNTKYYWQIITFDSMGNNSFSQIYNFSTSP
ncbi:MAG: hypothetical protein P8M03_06755 [Flavobacteriaceae bacterium]|nr:hypothetical protein [Flavobacteriaceae bacterium]